MKIDTFGYKPKSKVFYSCLNYDHRKQPKEQNNGESDVIPDQSLSIEEILKRFASGRSIDVATYEEYDGDNSNITGIDIRTMDIVEVNQLLDITNKNLQNLKTEHDRRRKEEQDAALEKSIIEKFKARTKQEDELAPVPVKFIQTSIPLASKKDD